MQIFVIWKNDSGQRLDRFLLKLLPNSTRWLIFKFIRKNKVKIRNIETSWKFKKFKIDYILKQNDEIKIFIDKDNFQKLSYKKKNTSRFKKLNKKDIIFEDDFLIIINKDYWINVHPWDYKTKELSLIDSVKDYLWKKYNSLTFSPSLIHRIDRDTSWIIMIAKQKDILVKLTKDFKNHKNLEKTYIALVKWRLNIKSGVIQKKLLRVLNAKSENKIQISEKGQKAITNFKVLKEYKLKTNKKIEIISKLKINIETWRMHQIRVHLSSIWHPVIWDNKYWDKSFNSYLCRNLNFCRQALHALELQFLHYWVKKYMKVKAPLKKDFIELINSFN